MRVGAVCGYVALTLFLLVPAFGVPMELVGDNLAPELWGAIAAVGVWLAAMLVRNQTLFAAALAALTLLDAVTMRLITTYGNYLDSLKLTAAALNFVPFGAQAIALLGAVAALGVGFRSAPRAKPPAGRIAKAILGAVGGLMIMDAAFSLMSSSVSQFFDPLDLIIWNSLLPLAAAAAAVLLWGAIRRMVRRSAGRTS